MTSSANVPNVPNSYTFKTARIIPIHLKLLALWKSTVNNLHLGFRMPIISLINLCHCSQLWNISDNWLSTRLILIRSSQKHLNHYYTDFDKWKTRVCKIDVVKYVWPRFQLMRALESANSWMGLCCKKKSQGNYS